MKKAFLCAKLLLLLCFGIFFCAENARAQDSQNPEEVLCDFLALFLNGEAEEAYKYLAQPVKKIFALSDFIQTRSITRHPIYQIVLMDCRFTVKDIKIDGDNALAQLEYTVPDFKKISDQFSEISKKSPHVYTDEEVVRAVTEHFNGKIPMQTIEGEYKMVKESDGWKVIPPGFKKLIQK